jgi:hypothetical protein
MKPIMNIIKFAAAKLKLLNMRTSMIGSLRYHSQMTSEIRQTVAVMTRVRNSKSTGTVGHSSLAGSSQIGLSVKRDSCEQSQADCNHLTAKPCAITRYNRALAPVFAVDCRAILHFTRAHDMFSLNSCKRNHSRFIAELGLRASQQIGPDLHNQTMVLPIPSYQFTVCQFCRSMRWIKAVTVGGHQYGSDFVLHEEHGEFRPFGLACVPPNHVDI